MTHHLLRDVGQDFSRRASTSYLDEHRPDLPWRILLEGGGRAIADRRVVRLATQLRELPDRRAVARNPELYPHVIRIVTRGYDEKAARNLLLQAGVNRVASIPRDCVFGDYLRFVQPRPRIYRADGGRFKLVAKAAAKSSSGFAVFLPVGGLFADLLPEQLSHTARSRRVPEPSIVDDALLLILEYSRSLADDFCRAIAVVVLTPPLNDPRQWSYNLRLTYLGGVFVDPRPRSRIRLADGLIHEYCHQRLWEWWSYEPLQGVDEGAVVRSPLTRRDRSVLVMIQALLIYVQLAEFHRFVIDRSLVSRSERAWAIDRVAQLTRTVPELYRLLAPHVRQRGPARRLIDFILSFSEIGKAA